MSPLAIGAAAVAAVLALVLALVGWLRRAERKRGEAEAEERQNRVHQEDQKEMRDAMATERDGRASDDLRRLRELRK